MSHRSKKETTIRRCKLCGQAWFELKGVRSKCPFKARHLFLFGKGRKK